MKRQANPYAKREFEVEFFRSRRDTHKLRSGFCMDIWGARVSAVKHLILNHYEMAVCVKRKSGRVLWTRIREGQDITYHPGDIDAE